MKLFLLAVSFLVFCSGEVFSAPSVQIRVRPKKPVQGEKIFFFAKVNGFENDPTSFKWQMSDTDEVISGRSIMFHKYEDAGSFDVTVIAENEFESAKVTKIVKIIPVNQKPLASFTISNKSPSVGGNVTLESTSVDPDGDELKYVWKIGKKIKIKTKKKKLKVPVSRSGSLKVQLQVIDGRGGKDSISKVIYVGSKNSKPIAKFLVESRTPVVGEEVVFRSRSKDFDGSIVEHRWSFGDGTTKNTSIKNVSHIYGEPGIYKVKLTVVDDKGKKHRVKKKIKVVTQQSPSKADPASLIVLGPHKISLNKNVSTEKSIEVIVKGKNGEVLPSSNYPVSWVLQGDAATIEEFSGSSVVVKARSVGQAVLFAEIGEVKSEKIKIDVLKNKKNSLTVSSPEYGFLGAPDEELNVILSTEIEDTYSLEKDRNDSSERANLFSKVSSKSYITSLQPFPRANTNTLNLKAKGNNGETFEGKKEVFYFTGKGRSLYFGELLKSAQISISQNPMYRFNSSFTLSFWVRPEEQDQKGLILSGEGAFSWTLESSKEGSGQLELLLNKGGQRISLLGGVLLTDKPTWKFVSITFDHESREISLYENGYLYDKAVLPGIDSVSGKKEISIGRSGDYDAFLGRIDEIRFWNTGLSKKEIRSELFNPADKSDLRRLAFYSFDTRVSQKIPSDSYGKDFVLLGNSTLEEVNDPGFKFATEKLAEIEIKNKKGGDYRIKASRLRRFGLNSGFDLRVPPFALDRKKAKLMIEIADSSVKGRSFSHPRASAIGPAFNLTSDSFQVTEQEFLMKVPFYQNSLDGDNNSISVFVGKVLPSGHEEIKVLTPDFINRNDGYASIRSSEIGRYWVGVKSSFTRLPEYPKPRFRFLRNGVLGSRIFSLKQKKPREESYRIPLDYTNSQGLISELFECNGVVSDIGGQLPAFLSPLAGGENYCSWHFFRSDSESKTVFSFSDQFRVQIN